MTNKIEEVNCNKTTSISLKPNKDLKNHAESRNQAVRLIFTGYCLFFGSSLWEF